MSSENVGGVVGVATVASRSPLDSVSILSKDQSRLQNYRRVCRNFLPGLQL